jgi:hypothetical protein
MFSHPQEQGKRINDTVVDRKKNVDSENRQSSAY